jgi:preprotein translocase subunit SecE
VARVDDTRDPLGHAAPDAELAEARLAAGEAESRELEPDPGDDERVGGGGNGSGGGDAGDRRGRGRGGGGGGRPPDDSEELLPAPRPARRRNGLVAFAQGSWRELQRVQWPDQRQVVQATGVVIGFVIVAGAYLGLADWVATKIVNFILS